MSSTGQVKNAITAPPSAQSLLAAIIISALLSFLFISVITSVGIVVGRLLCQLEPSRGAGYPHETLANKEPSGSPLRSLRIASLLCCRKWPLHGVEEDLASPRSCLNNEVWRHLSVPALPTNRPSMPHLPVCCRRLRALRRGHRGNPYAPLSTALFGSS